MLPDDPKELIGWHFAFLGGILTHGVTGQVKDVLDSPTAAGRKGYVVVWRQTSDGFDHGKLLRSTWSKFKGNVRLVQRGED